MLNVSVAMRIGETPVPIPNTTVKTYPADDTAWATVWESRWPPNLKKEKHLNSDRMEEEIFHDMTVQAVRKRKDVSDTHEQSSFRRDCVAYTDNQISVYKQA